MLHRVRTATARPECNRSLSVADVRAGANPGEFGANPGEKWGNRGGQRPASPSAAGARRRLSPGWRRRRSRPGRATGRAARGPGRRRRSARPAPAGTVPASGWPPTVSRSCRSGTAGEGGLPMTTPAHASLRADSASSVSAVWLSAGPRPGHDEDRRGQHGGQVGDGRPGGAVPDQQAPGAFDNDVLPVLGQRRDVGRRRTAGPAGDGRPPARPPRARADPGTGRVRAGPSRPPGRPRRRGRPGCRGGSPVWAGLTTATRSPRDRASAAMAAVVTVLPTPVPVPLTTMRPNRVTAAAG